MKVKFSLVCLCLLVAATCTHGQPDLLNQLNKAIDSTGIYDSRKLAEIERIKKEFAAAGDTSLLRQYDFYLKLYETIFDCLHMQICSPFSL